MVYKIVLLTYPGTFNYGSFSVTQPLESFTSIEKLYIGLPVQKSHDDNADVVGSILSTKISKNGYTYGLLRLDDEYTATSVSLGYYVDTTEIKNNSTVLVGKITPYHLALTNTPRKEYCAFDNLPTYQQFKQFFDMETNLLDLLNLFLMSASALEDATDVTVMTITEAADANTSAVDIFLGELSNYLQESGVTPATDTQELLTQMMTIKQDSLSANSYTPGALQKRVKDAITEVTKPVAATTKYKATNKTIILK